MSEWRKYKLLDICQPFYVAIEHWFILRIVKQKFVVQSCEGFQLCLQECCAVCFPFRQCWGQDLDYRFLNVLGYG